MQQIRDILSCEGVDPILLKSQKSARYYNMLCLFDDPGASENPISFSVTRHHNQAEVEAVTLNALIFLGPYTIKEAKNTLIQCFKEEHPDLQKHILQNLHTKRTWRSCEKPDHVQRISYELIYKELDNLLSGSDHTCVIEACISEL